jgi:hypothetical protein
MSLSVRASYIALISHIPDVWSSRLKMVLSRRPAFNFRAIFDGSAGVDGVGAVRALLSVENELPGHPSRINRRRR